MQDFFNKAGKTASAAANKAGSKAGEMVEVGKIKSKISSQKQEMVSAKREIGQYCYDLFKDEKIADDNIKALCEKIKGCEDEIAKLEHEIKLVKEDYTDTDK